VPAVGADVGLYVRVGRTVSASLQQARGDALTCTAYDYRSACHGQPQQLVMIGAGTGIARSGRW